MIFGSPALQRAQRCRSMSKTRPDRLAELVRCTRARARARARAVPTSPPAAPAQRSAISRRTVSVSGCSADGSMPSDFASSNMRWFSRSTVATRRSVPRLRR